MTQLNKLKIAKLKKDYMRKGTIMVPFEKNENPLSNENFSKLKKYCNEVNKEFIRIGDAGEKNHLLVGRFMTDKDKPRVVKNQFSKKVISILQKKEIIEFIKKILGIKRKLYLRRIQFNQIKKGCFVGYHLDVDSNPDYIAACVIQLGTKFTGGIYRVYKKKKKKFFDYPPTKGSLIISNCHYPHEVTKVKSGKRGSLVFFVSYDNGLNKKYI
jgi:Rps23 Pro-64 3,4-dihydroxylase Tpa1-like proline 4-hydroxylase